MEKEKERANMRNFKNCTFCVKTVFHYAPLNAVLSIICYYIPAFFTGLRMILMQYIVDSAVALANGTGPVDTLILWGVLLVVMLILWASMQQMAKYELDVIGMKLSEKMAPDIARRLTMLEYSAFEEKGVHEVFQKMSDEPEKRVKNCFYRVLSTGQAMVSLISGMAVFFSISVWIGLGVILIGIPMTAIGYYQKGEYQKCIDFIDDYAKTGAILDAGVQSKKADCYVNLKKYDEALSCYDDAISIANDNPGLIPFLLAKKARVCHELKDYAKELELYETIKKEYPEIMKKKEYQNDSKLFDVEKYISRAKALAEKK